MDPFDNASPSQLFDVIARRMNAADPKDTLALAAIRNEIARATAEDAVCDQPALLALAERALASIDQILQGAAKRPTQTFTKALKLLRAAAADPGSLRPAPPPRESMVRASSPPPADPSDELPPGAEREGLEGPSVETPVASAVVQIASVGPEPPRPEAITPEASAEPTLECIDETALVSVVPAERAPSARPAAHAAPAPVEAADEEPPDPELAQEFVGEAVQYLADAEAALLRLESNPVDSEAIGTVFRCFHTIKGVSAFLGLPTVTKVAHEAECLLSRMRDGEIRCSGGYASLALSSVDALKGLVADVAAGQRPRMTPALESLGARLTSPETHGISAEGGGLPASPTPTDETSADPAPAQQRDAGNPDTWIRVRTDRLDRLIDMVGELVIAQSMVSDSASSSDDGRGGLHKKVQHAAKIIRELQDLSMSLRMVPLRQTFQKVARVVRDVAQKSGRQVQFSTDGDDTEIDRNMVDVIADPLVHMARNAVDHGLESSPEERRRAGKPPQGNVRLVALRSGGEVVLQLTDDGRGIDPEKVAKKAIERGLIPSTAGLGEADILNLIFAPGFSTRDEVTDISGRGVGMDVVKRGVEALKGRIEISSKVGEGTTFSLRLPLTLAITDGMLVRVGSERYVIPSVGIRMSLRPDPKHISTLTERGEFLRLRGELVPIYRMHHVFGVPDAVEDLASGLLVVVSDGTGSAALLVDEVLGQQQVVTKSLGPLWGQLPGIAGGAILGDGRVGLILDLGGVAALARQRSSYSRPRGFGATAFDLS
jgi:two-component system chemotaxis sensor kinase CheA